MLAGSFAVAVLDGVDDRLADGHADPVHRVLVEADALGQVIADHLDEVQHVEGAAELETDDVPLVGHAWLRGPASAPGLTRRKYHKRAITRSSRTRCEYLAGSGMAATKRLEACMV